MASLATVSVEELTHEIHRHSQDPYLNNLLEELRNRNVDLREFCVRVRSRAGSRGAVGPRVGTVGPQCCSKSRNVLHAIASLA